MNLSLVGKAGRNERIMKGDFMNAYCCSQVVTMDRKHHKLQSKVIHSTCELTSPSEGSISAI